MGDVKLFALIGGTLGVMGSLITLVFACFLGVIAGGAMMIHSLLAKRSRYLVDEVAESLRPPVDEISDMDSDGEEAPAAAPLVDRLEALKRELPKQRRVHHLPFGPWIALGALLVLIFQGPIQSWIGRGMF